MENPKSADCRRGSMNTDDAEKLFNDKKYRPYRVHGFEKHSSSKTIINRLYAECNELPKVASYTRNHKRVHIIKIIPRYD